MTASAGADPTTGPAEDQAPLAADRVTHREASAGTRRRMAWRKGSDIDEELWPIETFGGISDEQFWDDLAADKPLATTARTAQAESGASTRPARAYPPTKPMADDRTAGPALQSVQATATRAPMATQPYPARTQQPPAAPQPARAARQPAESRGRGSAAAGGPGSDEDPLTSPAYALRPKGAVGGRPYQSSNRPGDPAREQYETTVSRHTQALENGRAAGASSDPPRSGGYRADPLRPDGYSPGSSAPAVTSGPRAYQPGPGSAGRYGGTAARPYPGPPRGQPAPSAQSMSTPPYGDRYGYRSPVGPAGDPRRVNGNGGHGRSGGHDVGEGNLGPHRASPPADGYRGPSDPYGRH